MDLKVIWRLVAAYNLMEGREPEQTPFLLGVGMERAAARFPPLIDQNELQALYGLGFMDGFANAMSRMQSILAHDAAVGQERLAIDLALDDTVSVPDAIEQLVTLAQQGKVAAGPAMH